MVGVGGSGVIVGNSIMIVGVSVGLGVLVWVGRGVLVGALVGGSVGALVGGSVGIIVGVLHFLGCPPLAPQPGKGVGGMVCACAMKV